MRDECQKNTPIDVLVIHPKLFAAIRSNNEFNNVDLKFPRYNTVSLGTTGATGLLVKGGPGSTILRVACVKVTTLFERSYTVTLSNTRFGTTVGAIPVGAGGTCGVGTKSILSVERTVDNTETCLTVDNNVSIPRVLNDHSASLGLGRYKFSNETLGDNSRVGVFNDNVPDSVRQQRVPRFRCTGRVALQYILNPRSSVFASGSLRALFSRRCGISTRTSEVKVHLDKTTLGYGNAPSVVSSNVTFNTIRIPGGNRPVVLTTSERAANKCTGPVAMVATSLPLLTRTGPKGAVHFGPISLTRTRTTTGRRRHFFSNLEFWWGTGGVARFIEVGCRLFGHVTRQDSRVSGGQ